MSQITVPSYPLSKEESGNASWKLLHNSAAQLPETLDRSDRVEFSRFLNMIIRKLPCSDCQRDAYGYMRQNPPKFETRKDVITYICEFHNDVNRKLHKNVVPCASLVVNEETCPTCGVKHQQGMEDTNTQQHTEQSQASIEEIPSVQETHTEQQAQHKDSIGEAKESIEVEPDLSEDFESYKQIQTRMFENLCKREKIPVPPIFHSPCPEHENTSCVRKNNDTGLVEVFLHPGTTDNKQRLHEFKHYMDIVKNVDSSEESANAYAMEQLSTHFPIDKIDFEKKKGEPSKVYADNAEGRGVKEDPISYDVKETIKSVEKKVKDDWTVYADAVTGQYIPTTANDPTLAVAGTGFGIQSMPYTAAVMAEANERARLEAERKAREETGFMSHFDPIYQFPSTLAGVSATQLNNIHTPLLISAAAITLFESNLTPFGSALVSFSLGIILFVSAVVSRARLTNRDLVGLNALSACFVWNTLKYANPKNNMKTTIMDVFKKRAKLRDMIVETPKQHNKKVFLESNQPVFIPHSAFTRTRGYAASAPSDISTIRIRQNQSQSNYDASRRGPQRGGRGLLPEEERALARNLGTQYNRFSMDAPGGQGANPGVDLYSTNDYEDDVYSYGSDYDVSPQLSQIQVINETGPSGY